MTKTKAFTTFNAERVVVSPSVFNAMKHYERNLGETITDHILEYGVDDSNEMMEVQNDVIRALKAEKQRVTRWLISHGDVKNFNPFHNKVA